MKTIEAFTLGFFSVVSLFMDKKNFVSKTKLRYVWAKIYNPISFGLGRITFLLTLASILIKLCC